jgi:hypothetical protein
MIAETRQQSIADRVQRLWVLERAEHVAASSGRADVCRFVNAIAVLGHAGMGIGFVRSCEADGSTHGCLATPRLRLNIERNATGFPTLDAAIEWAECRKAAWISQGWTELPQDGQEV